MDADRYLPVWARLEPIMRAKLLAIGEQLVIQMGLDPLQPPLEAGDEELRLDLNLNRAGTLIAGLEFTLFDGDVQDDEGFGLGIGCFGPDAEVLGGWYPGRYTEMAFTWDVEELLKRLEDECPVEEVASALAGFLLEWEVQQSTA